MERWYGIVTGLGQVEKETQPIESNIHEILAREWRLRLTHMGKPGKRLLLLRVFGSADKRERFLDALDDTWRRIGRIDLITGTDLAMRGLASTADAILLDLRGFTRTNEGSAFELAYLVQHTDLQRTVLLVDSTTDMRSLEDVARFAWTNQPCNSPNAQKRRPELIALNFETRSKST